MEVTEELMLYDESEERTSDVRCYVEMCKRSGVKVDADESKVRVLGGEKRSMRMGANMNIFRSLGILDFYVG